MSENNNEHYSKPLKRFLRRREVEQRTGYSCSNIYRLMSLGLFPSACRIGPGAVGWLESEIDEYIDQCVAKRDSVEG